MKILLDHCVPKRLKTYFTVHEVSTTQEKGWSGFKNGELLSSAGEEFEIFLTVDRNIKHQQNPKGLPVAIVILHAVSNRLETLIPYVPIVEELLKTIKLNSIVEIHLPDKNRKEPI